MDYHSLTMQNGRESGVIALVPHRHEPFHILKGGGRPAVEKGIMNSQEHGAGRGEIQNK